VLATLINRNALEALAGGTAFQRGEEYFAVGEGAEKAIAIRRLPGRAAIAIQAKTEFHQAAG